MQLRDDRREPASSHDEQDSTLSREGEALAVSASRSRLADGGLARALDRREPTGAAVTGEYLEELGRRSPLSGDDERELVAAAQAGDGRARARLVEASLPLIASVARVYRDSPAVDRPELMQEGVVGLLRALERYDASKGTPFWAYATWWVRQAMQRLVSELTGPVVLSDRALRQLSRLKKAHRDALRVTGREPTRDELAERSGLGRDQVDNLVLVDRAPRSVDEPVVADDAVVGLLGDLLADPLAEEEYERMLEAVEIQQLLALLSGLSERERGILRARFGLDGGEEETLQQIADKLGVSAERVRQLERRALGKIEAAARGDALAG
jgi:RNA polymerase sigma factor (sigma-70 family)